MTTTEPAAPVEAVADAGDELLVRFPVLVLENVETDDGRFIEADALTHRALPLTLFAQPETNHGGDEPGPAITAGRIDTLERVPGPEVISPTTGVPFPDGVWVWRGTGAISPTAQYKGQNIADMVRRRYLRGVSVDLVGMDYDIVGDGFDVDPDNPSRELITHRAVIAAATLVGLPAFGDAFVEVEGSDPPVELPELVAAVPSWRSAEVGDPVEPPPDEGEPDTEESQHTGGMIALVPANTDDLTVDGGEPADELHLTLAYLGDDVTGWSDEQRQEVLDGAQAIADQLGRPTTAEVMGHAAFNPTGAGGHDPCAVYLVSGEDLPTLKGAASAFDVSEHPVFLPHITAGFGLDPSALSYIGPVTFDRIRVALGDQVHDIPLGRPADTPADEQPEEGAMADQTLPDTPELDPDGTGMPDEPQPCQFGPEPAAMSLLFGDGQFVPVCDEHEQDARDQIAAAGQEVTGVVEIAASGDEDEPPADNAGDTILAAGHRRPPAAWFADPDLDGPTALHVGEDGRVYGHLAVWNIAHIGMPGRQVFAPKSRTGYAYFRTGALLADNGDEIAVGSITLDTGHAGTDLGRHAAAAHYDHTGTVVADVAAGEDEHGIWVAGALRANVDDETAARLRASALSGDWRRVGDNLELVAALAVNTPGFPIPRARVASGAPLALVAAGVLRPEPPIESVSVGKLWAGDVAVSSAISRGSAAGARIEVDPNGGMRWFAASGEQLGSTAEPAATPATLAAHIDAALARRERATALASQRDVLVASLDDTADRQAALVASLDDTGERHAALVAALDDGFDVSHMPPQLQQEWLAGEIAARIAWGTPGSFTRCQAIAREKGIPGRQIDGMCANLFHQATGRWPGRHNE